MLPSPEFVAQRSSGNGVENFLQNETGVRARPTRESNIRAVDLLPYGRGRPLSLIVDHKALFAPILWANALVFLPLVLANRPLVDDLGHSVGGYTAWWSAGRPFAEALFYLTNFGYPAVASQMLNQLLTLLFVSAAGFLAAALFGIRSRLLAVVATLPLTAHPYFLENFSYQFDGPSMAAGLFFAVSAAFFIVVLPSFKGCVAAVAFTFGCLAMYPPAINVFPCAAAVFAAVQIAEGLSSHGLRILLLSAVSLLVATSCYWAIVARTVVLVTARPNAAKSIFASFHDALRSYWHVVWSDWAYNGVGVVFVLILVTGFISLAVASQRGPFRVARVGISVALICLAISLQHGLLLILNYPWPLPRSYVSFGTVLSLVALITAAVSERTMRDSLRVLVNGPAAVAAGICLLVASATGSAMAAQRSFEQGLINQIALDISSATKGAVPRGIVLHGVAPVSPVMSNTSRKFPIVPRIVTNVLNDNSMWGHTLAQYYLGFWWQQGNEIEDESYLKSEPAILRPLYKVYLRGDMVTVVFR